MSEYTKREVKSVLSQLSQRLQCSSEELNLHMATAVWKLCSDFVAADLRDSLSQLLSMTPSSSSSAAHPPSAAPPSPCPFGLLLEQLDLAAQLLLSDLPQFLDQYVRDETVELLWLRTTTSPLLGGRAMDPLLGRCRELSSAESVCLAIGIESFWERRYQKVHWESAEEEGPAVLWRIVTGGDEGRYSGVAVGVVELIETMLEQCGK